MRADLQTNPPPLCHRLVSSSTPRLRLSRPAGTAGHAPGLTAPSLPAVPTVTVAATHRNGQTASYYTTTTPPTEQGSPPHPPRDIKRRSQLRPAYLGVHRDNVAIPARTQRHMRSVPLLPAPKTWAIARGLPGAGNERAGETRDDARQCPMWYLCLHNNMPSSSPRPCGS